MSARRKMAALFFSLVVIGGAWALADSVEKSPLRIIADTDTPVPGLEGATFLSFGQLDGVDPAISGRNVAFVGVFPGGIYALIDDELRVIANTQSMFPGSDQPFGFASGDGSSPSIDGENVAFLGRDGQPGPVAVCTYINGELGFVAKGGVTLVPGSTETFGSFHSLNGASPSISGENVAFTASSLSTNGIYAFIDGELRVIADTSTPVPGEKGVTFQNFGQLRGNSPTISGENVAFFGQWSAGGGVYAYINGELRVITDTNTPVPGGSGTFANPGPPSGARPSIDGENIVFTTTFPGGVYAYINGALRVIADDDTPAPGTSGTFGGFPVGPVISGENVAFGAGTNIGVGIFAYIDEVMQLIANRDTPIPGHEETTFQGFDLIDRPNFDGEGVRPSISGENVVFFGDANVPLKHHVDGIYARIVESPIPTVSTWSLIFLMVLLVSVGTVIVSRRGKADCGNER